ncbi:MAG: glycine cleavage system protein H [Deltaproteobacteria bacterium]|nr:glycine cleavage system protein H [Deltaproteobacteria bacterium]
MNLRNLRYTPDHLWVKLEDVGHVTVGLTEEGLKEFEDLGSPRNLPQEGEDINKDDVLCRISEADKGRGMKLLSPLTGEITAVNPEIADSPEIILEDPYEEGWLVQMSFSSDQEYDDLMSREEYDDYVAEDEDDDDDDYYDDDDEEEEDDDYFDDDDDDEY